MRPRSAAAPRTPSVPLALGPIRWLNLSKAGALLLNIYLSAGNLNEIVIVIVIVNLVSEPPEIGVFGFDSGIST